jgi:hypothetical protein
MQNLTSISFQTNSILPLRGLQIYIALKIFSPSANSPTFLLPSSAPPRQLRNPLHSPPSSPQLSLALAQRKSAAGVHSVCPSADRPLSPRWLVLLAHFSARPIGRRPAGQQPAGRFGSAGWRKTNAAAQCHSFSQSREGRPGLSVRRWRLKGGRREKRTAGPPSCWPTPVSRLAGTGPAPAGLCLTASSHSAPPVAADRLATGGRREFAFLCLCVCPFAHPWTVGQPGACGSQHTFELVS